MEEGKDEGRDGKGWWEGQVETERGREKEGGRDREREGEGRRKGQREGTEGEGEGSRRTEGEMGKDPFIKSITCSSRPSTN